MCLDVNLVFEVATPCAPTPATGPIDVWFHLINVGVDTATVNTRLAVSPPGGPGEVWLAAVGQDGNPVPFVADVNVGAPHAGDFATLKPHQSIGRHVDLRRYLLLPAPGSYTITASYHNASAGVEGVGPVAWTGDLTAEPAAVTVDDHAAVARDRRA